MIYFNSSVLRFTLLILMLAVGLAACGGEPDDDDSADDDDDDSADDDDDDSAAPSGTAYIVTTDYMDSIVVSVSLPEHEINSSKLTIASGDLALSVSGDDLWVLDRANSTAARYTGGDLSLPPSVEVALGAGQNPHQVVRCGDGTYISLYDGNGLAVLDDAGNTVGFVDLSSYADDDGGAEPDTMVVYGDTLWVALHRYDYGTWTNAATSYVLGIDCATNSISTEHQVGPNPSLRAAPDSTEVVVLQTGAWDAPDGTIELFDLTSGEGLVAASAATHGAPIVPAGWAVTNEGLAYGITVPGDGSPENPDSHSLFCLNSEGELVAGTVGVQSYLAQMAAVQGSAWLALTPTWTDPSAPHGVALLDSYDCTIGKAEMWMAFSLPPTQIVVMD